MSLLHAYHAIELANERLREADRRAHAARRVAEARSGRPRASIRRATAIGLAAISRTSAAAVRRLDARLAEDLGRRLAAGDGA